jgi:hypothetical protein
MDFYVLFVIVWFTVCILKVVYNYTRPPPKIPPIEFVWTHEDSIKVGEAATALWREEVARTRERDAAAALRREEEARTREREARRKEDRIFLQTRSRRLASTAALIEEEARRKKARERSHSRRRSLALKAAAAIGTLAATSAAGYYIVSSRPSVPKFNGNGNIW